MEDNIVNIIKVFWPILAAPIGWCIVQINSLKKDHYETRIHAAETFVKAADYKDDIRLLHDKLDKLMDKISEKADK